MECQNGGDSGKPGARINLDRLVDELGGGVILVGSCAKAGHDAGNLDLCPAMIAGGILLVPWTGQLLDNHDEARTFSVSGARSRAFGLAEAVGVPDDCTDHRHR